MGVRKKEDKIKISKGFLFLIIFHIPIKNIGSVATRNIPAFPVEWTTNESPFINRKLKSKVLKYLDKNSLTLGIGAL
jgi:hypothetical protein